MKLRIGSQPHGMLQLLSHVRDANPVTRGVARRIAAGPKVETFANGWHPAPALTVMRAYRKHMLGMKRSWGKKAARAYYKPFMETYRAAKREVMAEDANKVIA